MFALVARLIEHGGAGGVFLLMLAENVFPPLPSELIMPLAGFVSTGAGLTWWGAVLAGTAGSVLGSLLWYGLGRWLGLARLERWTARHGRWLTLTPQEVRRADGWFRRWGPWAVGVGRCLPGVRGVVCIPAGIAAMPLGAFLLPCTLGSLAWCVLLVEAGRLLRAHYARVQGWLDPVGAGFLLLCAAAYLYRVAVFRPAAAAGGGVDADA